MFSWRGQRHLKTPPTVPHSSLSSFFTAVLSLLISLMDQPLGFVSIHRLRVPPSKGKDRKCCSSLDHKLMQNKPVKQSVGITWCWEEVREFCTSSSKRNLQVHGKCSHINVNYLQDECADTPQSSTSAHADWPLPIRNLFLNMQTPPNKQQSLVFILRVHISISLHYTHISFGATNWWV